MLVGVACGFYPKSPIGVKKLNVRQLVVATPTPFSILLTIATDRNHWNGVSVSTNEECICLNETWGQDAAWIYRYSPYHGCI